MARVALIMATSFLFIWFAETLMVEFLFTLLLGTFLIIMQIFLLTRYVLGITRVIEQFIDAIVLIAHRKKNRHIQKFR